MTAAREDGPEVTLEGAVGLPGVFTAPLQRGFHVPLDRTRTVRSLFTDCWMLSESFVSERIGTIFLDGNPVDDLDAVRVEPGAVLALSGAMPGLAGAVFRVGSALAAFRRDITRKPTACRAEEATGFVRVKLFNVLIGELGPSFLRTGIFLRPEELVSALEPLRGSPGGAGIVLCCDGERLSRDALTARLARRRNAMIRLTVKAV